MIDPIARERIQQIRQSRSIVDKTFGSISEALELKKENKELMESVIKTQNELQTYLDKLAKAVVLVYGKIPQGSLPKTFKVDGAVKITDTPPISIANFDEVNKYLRALSLQMKSLTEAISLISKEKPPKIEIPKIRIDGEKEIASAISKLEEKLILISKQLMLISEQKVSIPEIRLPKQDKIDLSELIDSINDLPAHLAPTNNSDVISVLQDIQTGITALYNRPQMTPQPVTHVSLNSLNGAISTTQIQLGSTATPLPAIALANRRSLQVFNNGSNTIYLGGSNVTSGNGIPVAAGSYSDGFDFGINMALYGISGSGQNNDVRVLEIGDESSGR